MYDELLNSQSHLPNLQEAAHIAATVKIENSLTVVQGRGLVCRFPPFSASIHAQNNTQKWKGSGKHFSPLFHFRVIIVGRPAGMWAGRNVGGWYKEQCEATHNIIVGGK